MYRWYYFAAAMGVIAASCAHQTEEEEVSSHSEALSAIQFAPTGSGIDFVGLYRLRNNDGNECLKHDLRFGPCGTSDADTTDQVAVYRGGDGNYRVCEPVPPILVTQKECYSVDYISTTPDWGFDFIEFKINGGNIKEGAATGGVVEFCVAERDVFVFQAKCIGTSTHASADAINCSDSMRSNNQGVCISSHVISVKPAGGTVFLATRGNIGAYATLGTGVSNEFNLKLLEADHAEFAWYRRDTGKDGVDPTDFLSTGRDEGHVNYRWSPLKVPLADLPLAKKITPSSDARPTDATCSLSAQSGAGGVTLSWRSTNAMACWLAIDGDIRPASSTCLGSLNVKSLPGGPAHVAKVFVEGPSGTKACSASFNLTEPVSLSACPSTATGMAVGSYLNCSCSATAASSGNVWGIDNYTSNSSICRAAVHAGKITTSGGAVTVYRTEGLISYDGNTRNGVRSYFYGASPGNMRFVPPGTPIPTSLPDCTGTGSWLDVGRTYECSCSSDAIVRAAPVWGTDVYTSLSSICGAAVHAGKISAAGGTVTVTGLGGLSSYRGSMRNGVATLDYGSFAGSFSFGSMPSVSTACPVNATSMPVGTTKDCTCSSTAASTAASVWGTDAYTSDSNVCRAAVHAGQITASGGSITVYRSKGLAAYTGSVRNGVATLNFGAATGTFSFVPATTATVPACPKDASTMAPDTRQDCTCSSAAASGAGAVWGTDAYTSDSDICRAAVHAGKITTAGGRVTVFRSTGLSYYSASNRNGVVTLTWPTSYFGTLSFAYLPSTLPDCPNSAWALAKNTSLRCNCTTYLATSGGLWGTDYYAGDYSSICQAAVHAGKITVAGGEVTVYKVDGRSSYTGSTRYGVTSSSTGATPESIHF